MRISACADETSRMLQLKNVRRSDAGAFVAATSLALAVASFSTSGAAQKTSSVETGRAPGGRAGERVSSVVAAPKMRETYRATIDRYCATCHNDRLKTANLSLQGLDLARVGEPARSRFIQSQRGAGVDEAGIHVAAGGIDQFRARRHLHVRPDRFDLVAADHNGAALNRRTAHRMNRRVRDRQQSARRGGSGLLTGRAGRRAASGARTPSSLAHTVSGRGFATDVV